MIRVRGARDTPLAIVGVGLTALGIFLAVVFWYWPHSEGSGGSRSTDPTTSTIRPPKDAIRVNANQDWVAAPVTVAVGDRLTIEYVGGTWTHWSGGVADHDADGGTYICANSQQNCNEAVPEAPKGALVARIGTGRPFLVGRHRVVVAAEAGVLAFRINDGPSSADLVDNRGSIFVRVDLE